MSVERYYAKAAVGLISLVRRDPEGAFDTGMKLIGIGAILAVLAALLSD